MPPSPELAERILSRCISRRLRKKSSTLLQSPRYGERWARKWLDLARYADTNGYEKDRNRSIWPYRDWVINALNADMPFDQFTIEQIAGDMLPNATAQQNIATGFHRNTIAQRRRRNRPPGVPGFTPWRTRVATTGKTWLGLTTGCAQCHTHKFDPITHREYYQMMAFLNNADEPEFLVKPEDFETRRASVEASIAKKTDALRSKFKAPEPTSDTDTRSIEQRRDEAIELAFSAWLQKERTGLCRWTVLRPEKMKANLPLLTLLEDDSILASGDQSKADVYSLKFQLPKTGITAIRLEVLPDERLPAGGAARPYEGPRGDFNLSNLKATIGGSPIKFSGASAGFEAKNMPASAAIDDNLQSGWSTNGAQGKRHAAVFNLSEPTANATDLELELFFERHYSADLGRFRISITTDSGAITARDLPDDVTALLLLQPEQLGADQKQVLFREFLLRTPELEAARGEIQQLRNSLKAFPTTLVMKERPAAAPRPTFIHNRGEFLQPGEPVEPECSDS